MNLPLVMRQQTIWPCVTFCYVFLWLLSILPAQATTQISAKEIAHRFAPVLIHDSQEISALTSVQAQEALGWTKSSLHIALGRKISQQDPIAYYHVVTTPRYLYLQYWFFYSWNDTSHFGLLQRCTQHEGDWEHMALRLDRYAHNKPTDLYYARHKRSFLSEGKYVKPEQVRWQGEHPVVYVARGSHASYARAGETVLFRILGMSLADINDGKGTVVDLNHRLLPLITQPWFHYAGRWGASQKGPCSILEAFTPASNDGPTGPGFGDKVNVLRFGDWYDVTRKP